MRLAAALCTVALILSPIMAADKGDAPVSALSFKMKNIDGKETDLSTYEGKVVMFVNVASKCGYTKQYTGLEALYKKYKDKGFVIIGVPANNFGAQEPGSDAEIKQFCSSKYEVTFPMMSKVSVKGADMAPLYQHLTTKAQVPGDVKWNFEKFLINKKGEIVSRFGSKVTPESPELTKDIEAALAK